MAGWLSTRMRGKLGFDSVTKSKLDRWVAAKREKDFSTADTIRSELRAMGIEPDTVRPPDRDVQNSTPCVPLIKAKLEMQQALQTDPFINAKLDRWVAAKREKDFGIADAIRAEMLAVGTEPEQLRPADRSEPSPSSSSSNIPGARFDMGTEARLDCWV